MTQNRALHVHLLQVIAEFMHKALANWWAVTAGKKTEYMYDGKYIYRIKSGMLNIVLQCGAE